MGDCKISIEHKDLPEAALHKLKGAASAAANTVPVATGSGDTSFGFVNYANITNKPVVTTSTGVVVPVPKIRFYSVAAVAGIWTVSISGFSFVDMVVPVSLAGSTALGTTSYVTLSSFTTTTATGSVIVPSASANALGTTQNVVIMVMGS